MRAFTILALSATLAACAAPKPTNIVAGEACYRCKRPIVQAEYAAEQVQPNGLGSKFRTVHCMATWIAQQREPVDGQYYVTDFARRRFIKAERASFVRVVINPNTMERDFIAFADADAAAEAARANQATVVAWADVLEMGRAQPVGGN